MRLVARRYGALVIRSPDGGIGYFAPRIGEYLAAVRESTRHDGFYIQQGNLTVVVALGLHGIPVSFRLNASRGVSGNVIT